MSSRNVLSRRERAGRRRLARHPQELIAKPPSYLGGNGSPVVLLHGLNMTWHAWETVIPMLERHHTVFAPTLSGHCGGPTLPPASSGIAPFVDAVERQLDELGWRQAHLVGNSLGGWVALELARRGRAESMVLFSPAGAHRTKAAFFRAVLVMKLARAFSRVPGAQGLIRLRVVRRLMARMMAADPGAVGHSELAELMRNTRSCTALGDLLSGMDPRTPLSICADHVPTHVAWARKDRTLPWKSYGAPFCDLLPGASRVFLDGVGHVPMYEDPSLVAQTILEITSQETPRSA